MFTAKFGIEIEFTGITRETAAKTAAEYLSGVCEYVGTCYRTYEVTQPDGRKWKFMSDASIKTQTTENGRKVSAGKDYSVEMVSPILTYREDIETLQGLVRVLRKADGFSDPSCGIHIHLGGANHTPRSIRNFVNIIASKNDLLYKALQINPERMRFCQKMDLRLVEKLNSVKDLNFETIEEIWYDGYAGTRDTHYHNSRYAFINLHSFFHGHGTVELRGFNSTMHAGEIRSYIVLALALNHQALTQRSASAKKVQADNEKFAMRTYLNRIGLIGDEFKNCREHLTKHLEGSAAWRFGSPSEHPAA